MDTIFLYDIQIKLFDIIDTMLSNNDYDLVSNLLEVTFMINKEINNIRLNKN